MSPATALAPIAAEARPKVKRAFEVAITPDPVRVAHIRRIISAYMRFWGVPTSPADDVVLAVSELVTNGVEHGRGDVDLRVRHTGVELCVDVIDENPAPARLRTAEAHDVCGRGLFLVSVLAHAWGVSNNGRTTWATFRIVDGKP
ncbi:ATP-binding protein [Streptomyces hygroscopicus]|uniref:ATP-binding protein n=1 Tax=Streptomyces hygroscopicus TaxID=1912 RepID=UPI003694715F